VKEIGLNRIELCGVHADFTKEETFDGVLDTYRKEGVQIVSIGVQGFKNDPATEEKFFKFAQKAGAKTISANFAADSMPDNWKSAEKLADKYGINLAIHNHGGRHWLGSTEILNTVFARTSARIGLMLDTAWALDAGEDPLKMIEKFAGRLYGVHIKDFVFDRARKHQDVVVGTGNLKLAEMYAKLRAAGFKGLEILEYEGDVNNPVPALTQCVTAIRAAKAS
jgi:sugar phosphate isomerase/epimerase